MRSAALHSTLLQLYQNSTKLLEDRQRQRLRRTTKDDGGYKLLNVHNKESIHGMYRCLCEVINAGSETIN